MIVAMASLKSREGADEGELERTFERMRELVATIPGFLSYKNYVAEDGEELEVVRFESEAALESWRTHPEHLEAQRRGRDEFFDDYWVQVCAAIRQYRFKRGSGYVEEFPWSAPGAISDRDVRGSGSEESPTDWSGGRGLP
jgi:heme-degrading monooxygenase HmoA